MSLKARLLILAERDRQISVEGFQIYHDDQHTNGSLVQAGECYRIVGEGLSDSIQATAPLPLCWPKTWSSSWWKPTTRLRNLVKAGALYEAEIQRLLRLQLKVETLIERELGK